MDNQKETLSVEEVSTLCDVSIRTVYDWNKKGLLNGTRGTDNQLRFFISDLSFFLNCISIRRAAESLQIPYSFLRQWAEKNGGLSSPPFESSTYKYFVSKNWLEDQREHILYHYKSRARKGNEKEQGKKLTLFKDGFRLFDQQRVDGHDYWIVNVDLKELMNSRGERIYWGDGSGSSEPCLNPPYSGYEGRTEFVFPKKELPDPDHFYALGQLVLQLGMSNIIIYERTNEYLAACRNGLISYDQRLLHILHNQVITGIVWDDEEGNIVIGDYEVRMFVPIKYKTLLRIKKDSFIEEESVPRWIGRKVDGIVNGEE